MKIKLAVPENVLGPHNVALLERELAGRILGIVVKNFPDWKKRMYAGNVAGGEIMLSRTDWTVAIAGIKPGIHVTVSLVSYREGRDFEGLGRDIIHVLKHTCDDGRAFMKGVSIFLQMSLDKPVMKLGDGTYISDPGGDTLIELEG